MARPATRRTAGHRLQLPADAVTEMRSRLPAVADETVAAIIAEVPSYEGALTGPMGENIRNAVQLALGGFLSLASGRRGANPRTPTAPAVEGAYQLGRGEARSGRTTEALLAAYRVGARVSWREMSTTAVDSGVPAETLVDFAELVFAYIDELSAASVAGHTDELATTGRVRQRLLERIARHLLQGASHRDRGRPPPSGPAGRPPTTLTAVVVPEAQVRPVLAAVAVADPGGRRPARPRRPRAAAGARRPRAPPPGAAARAARAAARSPGRPGPWLEVRASYDRAIRARSARGHGGHRGAPGPARPLRRPRRARRPARPGARPAGGAARRARRRSSPTRCARGCSTTAGATTSPRSCSCTRRRCATGWASCATSSATGSTTPRRCSR